MSAENADRVRKLYEAFGRGDVPAVLGAMDPEIVWNEADNFIYAGGNPYVGPNAVLQGVFMRLGTEWEGFGVSPGDIFDSGDTVIAAGHYTGKFRKTGREVRAQFAHFFTFRDGKLVKFQQYTDTAQFKEAVS
jgi:ketosteroid isomerase-like protein